MKTRLFTGRRGRTAGGDQKATGSRREPERAGVRLNELAAELFAAILGFRAAPAGQHPPYKQFREEVVELLTDFQRRVQRAGLDGDENAMYALVALADETAKAAEWDGAKTWRNNPLEVDYFKDFRAGVEFFQRAERVGNGRDRDLIEIYYTCLCAGFRGERGTDPDGLTTIRTRLYQRLGAPDLRDEGHLTPDAYGHELERPLLTRRFPLLLALPFIVGAIGLYAAYQYILANQVGDIQTKVTAAAAAPAAHDAGQ